MTYKTNIKQIEMVFSIYKMTTNQWTLKMELNLGKKHVFTKITWTWKQDQSCKNGPNHHLDKSYKNEKMSSLMWIKIQQKF